jgi:tetratricopeptide (TPR) repeat protein
MYNESIPMLRRPLKIRRKVFGENHPDMAESLNNLAEVLREQDKYEEAEPLYRKSPDISRKVFGEDHPRVAISVIS